MNPASLGHAGRRNASSRAVPLLAVYDRIDVSSRAFNWSLGICMSEFGIDEFIPVVSGT